MTLHALALAVWLAVLTQTATATLGVDVSQAYGASHFSCLKSKGFNFAVVRASTLR